MKSFSTYITELEQDWQYMKKPDRSIPAVDDYGRTIDTSKANRTANSAVRELPQTGSVQPKSPSHMQKRINKLADSPAGTEGRAEYNLRRQHSQPKSINMLPRMTGPETDPEKEQNSTVDHQVLKKDTQDQMPEINVDMPKAKISRRM
jgi:hypothetical protein